MLLQCLRCLQLCSEIVDREICGNIIGIGEMDSNRFRPGCTNTVVRLRSADVTSTTGGQEYVAHE